MNEKQYAVFIIRFDRQNTYGTAAHRQALATIQKAAGFVELTDNVFIVDQRLAFSTIISLYSREEAKQAQGQAWLNFSLIPCGKQIFGANPEATIQALDALGLDRWETSLLG